METGINAISFSSMTPSDSCFSFHVRLHILMQEAAQVRERCEMGLTSGKSSSEASSIPNVLYLKSLRSKVHELVTNCLEQANQKGSLTV